MQLIHRTVSAGRRLTKRLRRWRDGNAAYPIDAKQDTYRDALRLARSRSWS